MHSLRKKPSQHRSLELVDAVIDAAARIFREHGLRGTTNQIAVAAGVSVGSLYQYFPNKLSLLAAWKQRFIRRAMDELELVLSAETAEPAEALRRAVHVYVSACAQERVLLRLCAQRLPARLDLEAASVPPHLRLLTRFFAHHRRAVCPHREPECAALFVGELVDSATRAALLHPVPSLQGPALERELMDAIMLYLGASSAEEAAPRR